MKMYLAMDVFIRASFKARQGGVFFYFAPMSCGGVALGVAAFILFI
jgi:hypothetical protein